MGLSLYNFFPASIGRARIPGDWSWHEPGGVLASSKTRKGVKRGKLNDSPEKDSKSVVTDSQDLSQQRENEEQGQHDDDDTDRGTGFFTDASSQKVTNDIPFRVTDIEIVPGPTRATRSLQLEGTLLSSAAETALIDQERTAYHDRLRALEDRKAQRRGEIEQRRAAERCENDRRLGRAQSQVDDVEEVVPRPITAADVDREVAEKARRKDQGKGKAKGKAKAK